jgi:hypothetical protein
MKRELKYFSKMENDFFTNFASTAQDVSIPLDFHFWVYLHESAIP